MSAHPDESSTELADGLAAVLERLDVPLGVAEAQGLACGLLCSRPVTRAKSRWFSELLGAASLEPDAVAARASDLRALDAWFGTQLGALNDSDLDFALVLPDDEQPLDRRLGALGEFCAGFVYGVGIGVAARGDPALPADTRELLEDFMAIDGADTALGAGGEAADDEAALIEIVEYVRMGVLLINEELKPVAVAAPMASPPGAGGPRPAAGGEGGDGRGEPGGGTSRLH